MMAGSTARERAIPSDVRPAALDDFANASPKLETADIESKGEAKDDASSVAAEAADDETSELRAWLVVLGTFASNAATMGLQGCVSTSQAAD